MIELVLQSRQGDRRGKVWVERGGLRWEAGGGGGGEGSGGWG